MDLEERGVVFPDGDLGYAGLISREQEHDDDSLPKPLPHVVNRWLERRGVSVLCKKRRVCCGERKSHGRRRGADEGGRGAGWGVDGPERLRSAYR